MSALEPLRGDEFGAAGTAKPPITCGSLVVRHLDSLRTHPSYVRHQLVVPMATLAALAAMGDLAFRDPLVVTTEGTIIDGYARFELAQRQGRLTLPCIEYELAEPESLQYLIDRHRRPSELNDFNRVLLALDLEPWLAEKARSNQQAGGHHKGSSNLTEAQRIDVRSEIAKVAGVSVGNVTKVKQLLKSAHPNLLHALRTGEIRIHRAWLWSKEELEKQCDALTQYRSERGVNRTIRALISRHRPKGTPPPPDLERLVTRLSALSTDELRSINVSVLKVQGKAIFVSEQLLEELERQGDLALTCTPNNH